MLFPTTRMQVRIKNEINKKAEILEIRKDKCKPMGANKLVTNEFALEHTSMRAWNMKQSISLITQNGSPILGIIMEDMSI